MYMYTSNLLPGPVPFEVFGKVHSRWKRSKTYGCSVRMDNKHEHERLTQQLEELKDGQTTTQMTLKKIGLLDIILLDWGFGSLLVYLVSLLDDSLSRTVK
jgi:hypothetical protein